MKTKNLMTALALSAMFAACSQDAELNEAIAKNDFSNIPMVEAEFTADFGAKSRMATQFGWELQDKLGLAWLGDNTIYSSNNFGMAYQNHPLFCIDANQSAPSFKTETMLYVGKYFAYLPYNDAVMSVDKISFSIAEQPLTTNANDLAKQAIYLSKSLTTLEIPDADGNVSAGSDKAGMGNNVKLGLELVTSPVTINFEFKNIEDLTGLEISNVKIEMMNSSLSSAAIGMTNFKLNAVDTYSTTITSWKDVALNAFLTNNGSGVGSGAVELEGELAVTGNELTTYALLLPAGRSLTSGTTALNITLTTNYGVVAAENVEVSNNLLFSNFGQQTVVDAEVDGSKIKSTAATVKTQEELEEVLTKLAAVGQTDAVNITLNPEVAANPKVAFTLTNFTMPEGLSTSEIKLIAGTNTDGTIEFEGENNIISKPVRFASPVDVEGNLTVEYVEGATFTVAGAGAEVMTIGHGAVLTNNGKIVMQMETVAADAANNLSFGKYVGNGEHAEVTTQINNLGEAQWIAGANINVKVNTNLAYAVATDIEEIEAAATRGLWTVRLVNAAITNNGDDFTIGNIRYLESYGNTTINVTKSNNGQSRSITFSALTDVTVVDGTLTVSSVDAANATLNLNTAGIDVATGAGLYMSNLNNALTVNYEGTVTLVNTPNIVKGTGNGTWNQTNN